MNVNKQLFLFFSVLLVVAMLLISTFHNSLVLVALILMCTIGAVYFMSSRISKKIQKEENKTRRQLTQNISHELKTPIASIMGYMESLMANPDLNAERRQFFVERSYHQSKRLADLVQDINTLNKLNDYSELYEITTCDVREIVETTINDVELVAKEKQCTIVNNLTHGVLISGNNNLLYSIFRNLIDNALAYAGEGVKIEVSMVSQDMHHYHFRLSDNGVGIPEKHLPHIFDRFYRIDAGRSRQIGGTGLGLAIVKNAVTFHKGSITAMNASGDKQGLVYEFTLGR